MGGVVERSVHYFLIPPPDRGPIRKVSFHRYGFSVSVSDQFCICLRGCRIDEYDAPNGLFAIIRAYRSRVPVSWPTNTGGQVGPLGKYEKVLDGAAFQDPRHVEFSSSPAYLPICVVNNSIEVPASDQKAENVINILQFR